MENFSRTKHVTAIQYIDYLENNHVEKQDFKRLYMDANMIDLDFDTPLYRIFRYDRFMETLKEKKLCLVKPKLWDDPFENFLLSSEGFLDDGRTVSFEPIREKLYGQCWSLKEECDGLWRNYTNYICKQCSFCDWVKRHNCESISIKVKTTVGKLMSAFYDMSNKFHCLSYFAAKVKYVSDKEIAEFLKKADELITDSTGVGIIDSLSVKRKSFEYEQEVRLIFNKPSGASNIDEKNIANPWDNTDVFKFSIIPDSLFDEITLNPWITADLQKQIKDEISEYYKGTITKSSLYEQPFFRVKI